MKIDVGLNLLSLYKSFTKAKNEANFQTEPLEDEDYDTTTVTGMTSAILSALEKGECDEAYSLLMEWTMNYPLENGSTILYNYLSVEIYLRMMDGEDDLESNVSNLNSAIDAANTFFMVNSDEGHPMDEIADEIHERISRIINSFDAEVLEEEDLDVDVLENPILLPKVEDASIEGRMKKAIKHHQQKYGDYLQDNERSLIKEICSQLSIDYHEVLPY